MSKKTIAWLYFSNIILQVILTIIFFGCLQAYNEKLNEIFQDNSYIQSMQQGPDANLWSSDVSNFKQNTLQIHENQLQQYQNGMTTSVVFMALGGILGLIAWISALVNFSRAQLWPWFILTFFFGGIMLFIYLVGDPQPRKAGQSPQAPQRSASLPNYSPEASVQPPSSHVYQELQPLSALEILQQRYARGEIDTATFEQMRDRLKA